MKQDKLKELEVKTWRDVEKEFDNQFCEVDSGPDGDGYDALPIKWNDSWSTRDEEDQIEIVKAFLKSTIQQVVEGIIGEDEKSPVTIPNDEVVEVAKRNNLRKDQRAKLLEFMEES